jgi:hypothetical protein
MKRYTRAQSTGSFPPARSLAALGPGAIRPKRSGDGLAAAKL